jgi:flagellin
MRINHNISALKANNQLGKTNGLLDKSLERLSSGYRINSAADDSAGLAISEKMRTQISGLDQASRNAADGISVIQTAEGALVEVESMLQRMRELAVQSANGTYTTEDRVAIQAEIDQLSEEVTRIGKNTEFNTMPLLDGTIDRKSFSNDSNVNLITLSDTVGVGQYNIEITQDARQAVLVGAGVDAKTITADLAGKVNINGETVEIKEGDTMDDVFQKIRDTCNKVGINVFADQSGTLTTPPTGTVDNAGYVPKTLADGDHLVFVSREYGSSQKMEVYCDNPDLCMVLGLTSDGAKAEGVDAIAKIATPAGEFSSTATVSVDGNKITVSDRNNFKMIFQVKPGATETEFVDATITTPAPPAPPVNEAPDPTDIKATIGTPITPTVSVLDAGPMDLQIGANEGQTMSVRIPEVTPATLGIDKVNIGTADGAQDAITLLDIAINTVSEIRSKLGAYQNRLEHSISNLDTTSENLTESLSRISDADMAEEMANYTQKNVLAQAGTSMLAQSNQRPQTILSLLQQ